VRLKYTAPQNQSKMKKILLTIVCALSIFCMSAETWKEIRTIDVPQSTRIEKGTTKSGKVKYYLTITDGQCTKQVRVSENNANHFAKRDNSLVLVIWQSESGKQRFSTRLKSQDLTQKAKSLLTNKIIIK
jgi:hypothetical protein